MMLIDPFIKQFNRISLGYKLLTFLFLFFLIFTRFYNLDHTARFTQDESRDLVRMRQIVVDKKITLIGPISNDNKKVFGSLTYYMIFPFTIASGYMPIGPAIGTAFWGVLTALLIIAITYKVNKKFLVVIIPLVLLWFPLLETSRWAWNPHYVLFWISLGILLSFWKRPFAYFAAGTCFALAFHNHYIALFATSVYVATLVFQALWKERKVASAFAVSTGYIWPFLPFVAFDLLHPPGLFFAKYLLGGQTPQTSAFTALSAIERVWQAIIVSVTYLAPFSVFPIIIGICLLALLIADIKQRKAPLLWFLPILAQLLISIPLIDYQTRYFLPAFPFLIMWLIVPRKGSASILAKVTTVILLLVSCITVFPQLTKTSVYPDMASLTEAAKVIAQVVKESHPKNPNLAVLSSPVTDPMGDIYRDTLSIYDIHFKTAGQYDTSENLFVISTSDEAKLKTDGAYALRPFKDARLKKIYYLKNKPWRIYWFGFGP
jgi:hypothetical protein